MVIKSDGMTLLELMLTVVISTIFATGVYRIYGSFAKNNVKIQKDIVLQEKIQRSSNILEKDIRMAGLQLPGSGIDIDTMQGSKLFIFKNDNNTHTLLVDSIKNQGDTSICVSDDCNVRVGDFLCLHDLNYQTIQYYRIRSRNKSPSLTVPDTINIDSPGLKYMYNKAQTRVYFASAVRYQIEKGELQQHQFIRRELGKVFVLNKEDEVTNIQCIARDSNRVITADLSRARTLTVKILKRDKQASNTRDSVKVISSVEVAIRNYH